MKSGMNGIAIENDPALMAWMETITQKVTRHDTYSPVVAAPCSKGKGGRASRSTFSL
jgi:hypothetical protein